MGLFLFVAEKKQADFQSMFVSPGNIHLIYSTLGSLKQISLIMPCPVQRTTCQTDGLSSEQIYVHKLGPEENDLDSELPWSTALRCDLNPSFSVSASIFRGGTNVPINLSHIGTRWYQMVPVGISANQDIQLKNKIYEFHKIWAIRGQPFDSNFASIVCNALSQSKAPVPARSQISSDAPAELKA